MKGSYLNLINFICYITIKLILFLTNIKVNTNTYTFYYGRKGTPNLYALWNSQWQIRLRAMESHHSAQPRDIFEKARNNPE